MKKIYWKYNPYTLTTEFLVDGEKPVFMSNIEGYIQSGVRLQEHIEKIPSELEKIFNDNSFEITFCGTIADFSDVCDVFNGENYILHHQPVDESNKKNIEEQIDNIFKKILNGPFEELKENRIKDAYNKIKNNELDISVVAPMSAGKSTLINALLGEKLMPSQASACTATITKIKDCDKTYWDATVKYKNGTIEKKENISQSDMKIFNQDETVEEILLEGDIPFVTSEETALVLVDTPGPNNARNIKHGNIQRNFISNSSKSLILYVLEHSYENTDNTKLLEEISEKMKINGKQNKDRFIFVLNKIDTVNEEDDGSIKNILEDVRIHLESKGIPENPKIFPISAYQALLLRMKLSGKLTDVAKRYLKTDIFKYDELFLEKYAPLPTVLKTSLQEKISSMTEEEKLLVHTGIISLEEYIRLYLTKYAHTSKIYNLIAIFNERLNELAIEETIKQKLSQDETERNKLLNHLDKIKHEINSGNLANRFIKDDVPKIVRKIQKRSENIVEEMRLKYTRKIRGIIDYFSQYRFVELDQIESIIEDVDNQMHMLAVQYEKEIIDFIEKQINDVGREIETRYRELLSQFSNEISEDIYSVNIDISLLVNSDKQDDSYEDDIFDDYIIEIENENIKWYKPWTWFEDDYLIGIRFDEFIQSYFADIETDLDTELNTIKTTINGKVEKLVQDLSKKIKKIDNHLSKKMTELTEYGKNKDMIEKHITINKEKLAWINAIRKEIEEILELKVIER